VPRLDFEKIQPDSHTVTKAHKTAVTPLTFLQNPGESDIIFSVKMIENISQPFPTFSPFRIEPAPNAAAPTRELGLPHGATEPAPIAQVPSASTPPDRIYGVLASHRPPPKAPSSSGLLASHERLLPPSSRASSGEWHQPSGSWSARSGTRSGSWNARGGSLIE
jgi:hypothetical protein